MKLFENHPSEVLSYLKQPIIENDYELEIIFGSTPYKNPIDKKIFMNILEKCKMKYKRSSESINLDITTEYYGKPSNVRATIHGLDSIKKYCKDSSLEDILNVEYLQKKLVKDKQGLKDENYNVRLKIKTEEKLHDNHHFVKTFNHNYQEKKKHYRYKKRFSFITGDQLFRIDLTILKSTKYHKGKYDFQKTFKQANILNNPETYELEIEYIGWKKDKITGNQIIDKLYHQFMNEGGIDQSNLGIDNMYDPLHVGIDLGLFEGIDADQDYTYEIHSPRFDDNSNPKLLMRFTDSSIRYTKEDYHKLIGKSTLIKKDYFLENNIDMRLHTVLVEYSKKGIIHGTISEIFEEIDEKTNKYIDTKVRVSFFPEIANYKEVLVPLKYLYGGNFIIEHDKIKINFMDTITPERTLPWEEDKDKEKKQHNLNMLVSELLNILEDNVIYLSKIIYNTDELISYQLKEDILKEYKKLTNQKTKYFTFIGPQPISLNKSNIDINNPNSILVDYAVTEKADGERYELLIIDNNSYLINAKKNIIATGNHFPNIKGKWLFDGEYITKDKFNEPMNLFMIFDVYWCNIEGVGIPKEAHTLPFLSRDPLDIRSRKYILDHFNNLLENKADWIPKGKNHIDIKIKNYDFGYQTTSINEKIDSQSLSKDKYIQIFKASKNILQKNKEDYYQYRIDGLIYLPTRLSIRGSSENVNAKKIAGTWKYNYKWKEPKENTIDFQIKIESDIHKGKIKQTIRNYINKEDNSLNGYKKVNLFVGYKETDDDNINYCMKILTDFSRSKDIIQKFNIHSPDENKYNSTNIPLENGKMLCNNFEKSEIKDGDIVEMRFNPNAKEGMFWEPIRIRTDKIKPQYLIAANNIWKTIIDPITEEIITGSNIIKGDTSPINSGLYYMDKSDDLLVHSFPLRKFHNYIKSRLISGLCSSMKGKIKVLDLSIGQGGDIDKYMETNNVKFLYGIDISANIHEACRRFYSTYNKSCKTVFLRGDTSKNIKTIDYSDFENYDTNDKEHTDIMTNILYGKDISIPKKYAEIRQRYFGLATSGFDIISSQFSMHYYFKSKNTLNGFLRNLNENIKKGGYFIGTCYDGQKIFNHFQEKEKKLASQNIPSDEEENMDLVSSDNDSSEQEDDQSLYTNSNHDDPHNITFKDIKGNIVYSITKKYTSDNFDFNPDDDSNMFGNVIDVYMDSIGQTIPEYIVNFDFFIQIMKENGFEPVIPKNIIKKYSFIFKNNLFNQYNIGSFHAIIEKLPEIERLDKDFKEKYNAAKELYSPYSINPMSTLSSFNNYFIFQKK